MSSACAGATGALEQTREGVGALSDGAGELSERARFCFALARAVSAVESGSPDTAREAAHELLAHTPDELIDEARRVIDAIEDAHRQGTHDLRDPELRNAAERLRQGARQRCDLTEGSS